MSRRDDAIEEAAFAGRWSFSVAPATGVPFAGSGLLYSGPLSSTYACQWTISLNAMRYHGGPVNGSLVDPSGTLDNQVQNLDATYRAAVYWGVDGAPERAIVDYPFGGCTFGVVGANVRVDVFTVNTVSPGAPTTPLLSGFLTPSPNVITSITAPTFTTGSLVIAVLGSAVYAVPARAAAFRVYTSGSIVPAALSLRVNEAMSNGSNVKRDGLFPPAAADEQSNSAGYIPLHQMAQYVTIDNLSGTQLAVAGVVFLLDMG